MRHILRRRRWRGWRKRGALKRKQTLNGIRGINKRIHVVRHLRSCDWARQRMVGNDYTRRVRKAKKQSGLRLPTEDEECTWQGEELYGYYIRSTVLGGEVISEGSAGKRPVIVGGEVIAYLTHRYEYNPSATYDAVHFRQVDASGSSERVTRAYPENIFGMPSWDPDYIDQRLAEFGPTGGTVGTITNVTLSQTAR